MHNNNNKNKKGEYNEDDDVSFTKLDLCRTWYQILHTKMFWEGANDFNMKATYTNTKEGFSIKNCYVNLDLSEAEVCLKGEAIFLKDNDFFVFFDGLEKKQKKVNFRINYAEKDSEGLKWIVVVDPDDGYFSVLHRNKHISEKEYEEIFTLVEEERKIAKSRNRVVVRDRQEEFISILGDSVHSKHGNIKKELSGSHIHSKKVGLDSTTKRINPNRYF